MHKTTEPSVEARNAATDRLCQLTSLFFFLRHFGPEYAGPAYRPKLDEIATCVRGIGELGDQIAGGAFEPIDDLENMLTVATTFELPEEVAK